MYQIAKRDSEVDGFGNIYLVNRFRLTVLSVTKAWWCWGGGSDKLDQVGRCLSSGSGKPSQVAWL